MSAAEPQPPKEEGASLPYSLWYQCKRCTHLFYNGKAKILAHLRDKHGYNGANAPNSATKPQPPTTPTSAKSTPLKIKEHHFRPVTITAAPKSTSSGTDGEDTYAEDILNNNNSYATNNLSKRRPLPKLFANPNHQNNNSAASEDIIAIDAVVSPQPHPPPPLSGNSTTNKSKPNSNANNNAKKIIPSIEELKKQLLNSDIDISEIKISSINEADESGEEYEEEEVEGMDYAEEPEEEGIYQEYNEDGEENSEEGASISNQSFYDNDIGEHFLFKSDQDSESNYEDEGIMTPSFGMVDEFYRRASMAVNAASSTSDSSNPGRKRTYYNPCKLCNKNFPSLSMLKKHAKTHLNEDGGAQHICKFCFEYFPSAAGLSKHLKCHTDENPNVCTVCSKSFTSWATLRTHLKIHSGDRPFGCDQCGQRFQTKSTLDSHLRIHSGSRPHVCPICSKSFRTSSPLYRHMRSVHKGLTIGNTISS